MCFVQRYKTKFIKQFLVSLLNSYFASLQLLLTFDPIIVEKVAILLLNMMVVSVCLQSAFCLVQLTFVQFTNNVAPERGDFAWVISRKRSKNQCWALEDRRFHVGSGDLED